MSKAAELAAYQAGLKTALIEFTDGDDAIAIADAGVVTLLTTAVAKSEGGAVTTNIAQGLAKAWITFSGDGSTIRDSSNIASLVDDGTGIYSYNFTSSMGNTHYTSSSSASYTNDTNNYETYLAIRYTNNLSSTRTTGQNNIGFWETAFADPANDACSSILGDLA